MPRIIAMSVCLALLIAAYDVRAQAGSKEDVLCGNVDPSLVERVPEPFDRWVTIICTDDGQALVPEAGDEGILWLIHDSTHLFIVPVLPPTISTALKRHLVTSYGPEVRFVELAGGKLEGTALSNMQEIFIRSFPSVEPRYQDVYQLDAVSVYNGFIYNLFFYVTDDMPNHLVVCMLRCGRSVSVDVMRLEEVQQRLQEQADPEDAPDDHRDEITSKSTV